MVTKAREVAHFGYDSVMKVNEVAMIYIPSDNPMNVQEQRYVKIFQVLNGQTLHDPLQSVDLSTDFYFSYTYDLSRSMQENARESQAAQEKKFVWNEFLLEPLRRNRISQRWMLPVVHGYVGAGIHRT